MYNKLNNPRQFLISLRLSSSARNNQERESYILVCRVDCLELIDSGSDT